MSLDRLQTKRNGYLLEKADPCGATPEGEDDHSPRAREVHFERRIRIIDPAPPFTVSDHGVHGFTILVRTDL